MKVLIIEDDQEKSRNLQDFLKLEFKIDEIINAVSLNSGLRALISNQKNVDIVLLDMSMPTYDISVDEPTGGTPESFAGRDLLAQMKLRSIQIPTIIVTQFDSFGSDSNKVSLEILSNELQRDFHPVYQGHVYYNSTQEAWKQNLRNLIESRCTEDK